MGRGTHRGFITYEELSKSLGKRNLSDENLAQAFIHILDENVSLVEKKSDFKILRKKENSSKEEGKICTITEGHLTCIKPLTCVQITSQIFCISSNAALPCTEEGPCIVNFLGMNCAYKKKPTFGCCSNIETLEQKLEAKTAGGASPVLEMTR